MDFKALRKQCALCPETEYARCKQCQVYWVFNTPCEFCKNIDGVEALVIQPMGRILVCPTCFKKLSG